MKQKKYALTQKALSFWGGILILWSLYRSYFRLPIEIDELIIKPIVFITPIIYFIKKIEKESLYNALWLEKEKLLKDFLFSFVIVIIIICFYLLLGLSKIINIYPNIKIISFQFLVINLATSISEEILSHGFILKKLYEENKKILQSSFIASILYFILRIPILFTEPTLTGTILVYTMITSFFLSFALSLIFLFRKSLWSPIFLHFIHLIFVGIFSLK